MKRLAFVLVLLSLFLLGPLASTAGAQNVGVNMRFGYPGPYYRRWQRPTWREYRQHRWMQSQRYRQWVYWHERHERACWRCHR